VRPARPRAAHSPSFTASRPTRCAAMLMKLEEMQLQDTLRMFNGLVERCFCECVVSFRSKALTATEEKCVSTCAEKYMKHSVRQCPVRRACSHAAPSCPHAAPRRDGWVSALANSRWRSSKHRRRQPPEQDNSGLYTCARSIAVCAVCVPSRTPALGRAPAARVASVVLHSSVGWLFSFCSHAGKSRPSLQRAGRARAS
jgi:hypothetical protein